MYAVFDAAYHIRKDMIVSTLTLKRFAPQNINPNLSEGVPYPKCNMQPVGKKITERRTWVGPGLLCSFVAGFPDCVVHMRIITLELHTQWERRKVCLRFCTKSSYFWRQQRNRRECITEITWITKKMPSYKYVHTATSLSLFQFIVFWWAIRIGVCAWRGKG